MKRPVVIALLALCGLSCGCRDRFDVPDTPADAPAANITIASLHAFLHAETVVVREELTVSGTVVSSDEAGNFYRTLVLDDGTGGAELRIAEYNLYTICPPGCRLTVSLRGCALGERNGVLQIGLPPDAYSPYPTGYISSRVLLERLLHPTGERQEPVATPCEIARLGTASCGRLVRIDALRFRPDAEQAVPLAKALIAGGLPANVGGLPAFRRRRGADDRRLYECLRPFRRSGDSGGRVLADGCARIRHGRQLRQTIHPPNAR